MALTFGELQLTYQDILAGSLRWWQSEFPRKTQRLLEQYAANGIARSGAMIQGMTQLAIEELRERSNVSVRELLRIVRVTNSKFSADELIQAYGTMSDVLLIDIRSNLLNHLALAPNVEGARAESNASLTNTMRMIAAQAHAELALFAKTDQSTTSLGTNIHVQGSVGAIQTGPSAVANVSIQDNASLGELLSSLDRLREVLSSERQVGYQEAVDLIDGAKTEAQSSNPNTSRLRALLASVPVAIQVAGSIEPAYHAVKVAAQAIGVQLP
jgi:hypothetical protein